ncbi:WDR64 [Bugula neritina]|uniref:WDR64 n=1 Tax=Bugula neritina TaxID=10212 RepID=A0A7J7JMF9_BUGNE|nr:WDR64 [Bugula neritina]
MEATAEERRQIIAETLRFEEFCEKLSCLFEDGIKAKDLKTLFRKISNNPDAKIDWCELFGYESPTLSAADRGLTPARNDKDVFAIEFRTRAGNVSLDKRRLDTTRSMAYCKHIDSYIVTSKKGIVSLWNTKLENVYYMDMPDSAWLIDCVFLPHFRKLLCVTERGLVIWDYKAKSKLTEFHIIKPFTHAIVCMTYISTMSNAHAESVLLGDDQGYVSMVTITQTDLLKNQNSVKKLATASRSIVEVNPKDLVIPVMKRKVHSGWTLKLLYVEELRSMISCSPSAKCSLVVEDLNTLFNSDLKPRCANIHKGVNTFAFSTKSSIVATAGSDKIIRIWHPAVLTKPTGKLIGHLFTVTGIQINEKEQHIISLSSARVVRVWCMNTMTNLQIFTDHDDRAGDTRINVLYYDQKQEVLFTGSGVLDCWSLARTVLNKLILPQSHETPIVQVVYNSILNQFISLCTEPIIKVWSCESRNLVYQIVSPHTPGVDVTCMCVCDSGYRLATGAIDGSLKIWDIGAGQEIKSYFEKVLEKDGDESLLANISVVSLVYLPFSPGKSRLLIACGWSQEVRLYSDSDSDSNLQLVAVFSDSHVARVSTSRTNTILTSFNTNSKLPRIGMTLTTPHKGRVEKVLENDQVSCTGLLDEGQGKCLLLVGTHFGSIIVWDTDTHSIVNVYKPPTVCSGLHSDILNSQLIKTVHAVGTIQYSKESLQRVDQKTDFKFEGIKNQFLGDVETDESKGGFHRSVIISIHGDAGIRLWNTSGKMLCQTVAMTRRTGVAVTAYNTDISCKVLYTGDQLGYITLWRIQDFLEGSDDTIQQVVSWRGHTSKITSIQILPHKQNLLVYSASVDGSIRIWFDQTCRYLGYMGQGRPILIPSNASLINGTVTPQFPCDIKELPLFSSLKFAKPNKSKDTILKVPLVTKQSRNTPAVRHTAEGSLQHPVTTESTNHQSHDIQPITGSNTKYFQSLMKPRQYNSHLTPEQLQISDIKNCLTSGFVFRTLPVYRISTPQKVLRPINLAQSVGSVTHTAVHRSPGAKFTLKSSTFAAANAVRCLVLCDIQCHLGI